MVEIINKPFLELEEDLKSENKERIKFLKDFGDYYNENKTI